MPTPYDKLVDKLADIETSGSITDASYLNDVRSMLTLLLQSGRAEREIRKELASQSADGLLRTETVDLVSTLLDGMTSEDIPTTPQAANVDDAGFNLVFGEDAAYSATTVIESVAEIKKERDQELQVGSVLRDRFMLQEKVSGGSMGVVFKALDRRRAEAGEDSPYVAIKVLSPKLSDDPKALRALQQEAAKGRFLSHPNIVRFIDLDRDDDMYFIVMEWLDGENLANILDNSDRMDASRALQIVSQIGSALEYAHNRGIVHADVKPANVMILPNGDAMLFDFGVARIRQQQDATSPGFNPRILGAMTPEYSSMQVLTGDEPAPQDDVFSLACLYYRLVAGHRVFGPRNAAEAAEEGMAPQALPELTDSQWKAVKKALSFSRVTRYQSVRDFLQALLATPTNVAAIAADRTTRLVADEGIDTRSRAPWFIALALLVGGLSAYLLGVFDPWLYSTPPATSAREVVATPGLDQSQPAGSPGAEVSESLLDASATSAPKAEERLDASNEAASAPPVEAGSDIVPPEADALTPPEPATTISPLPTGDVQIRLDGSEQNLVLRENSPGIVVDLIAVQVLDRSRQLEVRELRFTGNRSPLLSREMTIEPGRDLVLPAGMRRVQLALQMTPDPVREADQQIVIEIVDSAEPAKSLSTLRIELEDDDQRRFEAGLSADTIAFAVGQVSVSESDAFVQVDLVRFKPSSASLRAEFTVTDVTATAGADYFPPERNFVEFASGERSARLLIPLVQDAEVEGDEAFVIELVNPVAGEVPGLYQRSVVMIRDDD